MSCLECKFHGRPVSDYVGPKPCEECIPYNGFPKKEPVVECLPVSGEPGAIMSNSILRSEPMKK